MAYEQSVAHYTSQAKLWARRVKQTVLWTVCSQSGEQFIIATWHGVCEAVNPLIKQSAEEILHTLLNENKNKFQEENHHFIFSVSYGEIP